MDKLRRNGMKNCHKHKSNQGKDPKEKMSAFIKILFDTEGVKWSSLNDASHLF